MSDRGSYSYVDGCLYDSDRELIPTRPLDESIIDHNDDMHSDESDEYECK